MKTKGIKKSFAVILSLALVIQCIPSMAFATENSYGVDSQRAQTYGYKGGVTKAEASDDKYSTSYDSSKYKENNFNYVALGDSITQGFSLEGFTIHDDGNNGAFNGNVFYNISNSVETAYPEVLGTLLEDRGYPDVNVKNLAMESLTTQNLYDILRGEYDAEDKDGNTYSYGPFYFCVDGTMVAQESKMDEAIDKIYGIAYEKHSDNWTAVSDKWKQSSDSCFTEDENTTSKAKKAAYLQTIGNDGKDSGNGTFDGVNYAPYVLSSDGKSYVSDNNFYVKGVQPIINKMYLPKTKDYTSLFRDQLKDADLVTVAIGSNELMRELNSMLCADNAQPDNTVMETLNQLMGATNGGSLDTSSLSIGEGMSTTELLDRMLNLESYIDQGLDNIREYYPKAIEKIRDYAPDAQIALLGAYNSNGINSYAYLIASMVDKRTLTSTLKTEIDNLVSFAVTYASKLSDEELSKVNENFKERIAKIKERVSSQGDDSADLTETLNDVFFLIMPVIVALMDTSMGGQMSEFSEIVEDCAEEYDCTYVSLENVRSSGTMDPHPTAEGHSDIANEVADAIISEVEVEVEGSGTVTIGGEKVVDGSSIYIKTNKNQDVVLTPAEGYKLYSVSVGGKYQTPSVDSSTGVGTLSLKVTGESTIKVKFVSEDDTSNGIGVLNTKGKYKKVVALGDSMTAGIGLTGFDSELDDIINMVNSKSSPAESYPNVLSQYLGAELLENYGSSALTTFGLYGALTDTSYNFNYLKGIDLTDTYFNIFTQYGEFQDADLITLQVGYSELLFGIVSEMIAIDGVSDLLATDMVQQVMTGGTVQDLMETFITTMREDSESTEAFYRAVLSMLKIFEESSLEDIFDKSIVTINEYLPKVIDKLQELNPNVDIALIGYYNPYKLSNVTKINVTKYTQLLSSATDSLTFLLDKDSIVEMFDELDYPAAAVLLGTASETAIKTANSYIKACAADDPKVTYVDITDIEREATLNPYPGTQGHIDIANKAADALINQVTITSNGGKTEVTPYNTDATLTEEQKLVTVTSGETTDVSVKFSETLHFDLGYDEGQTVSSIKVDGKDADVATNFYLSGNKADRTVEVTYGTKLSGDLLKARKSNEVEFKYDTTDSAMDLGALFMNDLDEVSYTDLPYMIPEEPSGLTAPSGKMFGGWTDGTTVYQPGEIVKFNTDKTLSINWVTDPSKASETYYKVNVVGGVTVDGLSQYKAGSKVFVYANDVTGGTFKGWTSSSEKIFLVNEDATCTYFFMPDEDVTLTANWEGGDQQADTGLPFADVSKSAWYYEGVKYCYDEGIMKGITATIFGPDTTINRAMIVTMLYRMEGEPSVSQGQKFVDVPVSSYYDKAVRWAYENNIVEGYDARSFGPLDLITREQLATIFYRYTQYKGYDTTFQNYLSKFKDSSKISKYAVDAVAWAYYKGLINGTTDTTIDPKSHATRAQAAAIIQRYDEAFGTN